MAHKDTGWCKAEDGGLPWVVHLFRVSRDMARAQTASAYSMEILNTSYTGDDVGAEQKVREQSTDGSRGSGSTHNSRRELSLTRAMSYSGTAVEAAPRRRQAITWLRSWKKKKDEQSLGRRFRHAQPAGRRWCSRVGF